jgi:hypothetical protein
MWFLPVSFSAKQHQKLFNLPNNIQVNGRYVNSNLLWGQVAPKLWVAPAKADKPEVKNDTSHPLWAVLPCINGKFMHYGK